MFNLNAKPNVIREVVKNNLNREVKGLAVDAKNKEIENSILINISRNVEYKKDVFNLVYIALPSEHDGEPHNVYCFNDLDGGILNVGKLEVN